MYNNNFFGPHNQVGYHMGFSSYGTGLLGLGGFGGLFVLGIIWSLAIKGYALWHAARRNEPWWFFFLLVINTFGILELIYLIFVAKVLFSRKEHHHHPHNHTHSNTHSQDDSAAQ
jgi:hypothetical protein